MYNKSIILKLSLFIIVLIIFISCSKNDEYQLNNWETVYQNNDLYLFSVNFLENNNGFVLAGLSGIHGLSNWLFVLSTEDGGNSWKQITCTSYDSIHRLFPLYDIGAIFPLSKSFLLATGYCVHQSNDGGKSWTNVSPSFSRIDDLHIIDSISWLVAAGTHIYRTDNAGQTWQTVYSTNFMGAFEGFSFISSTVGYINIGAVDIDHGGSVGMILKTTDGGKNWNVLKSEPWKSNNSSMPYVIDMQFISEQVGYISTYCDYQLYKSIDGGNTWALVPNNMHVRYFHFINENMGYSNDGSNIYKTINGGKFWRKDYCKEKINDSTGIDFWTFTKTGLGFGLTRDHKIIRKFN